MPKKFWRKRTSSNIKIDWQPDVDIKRRIVELSNDAGLNIDLAQIICFRSHNANTRAYARIWGLPRIWQLALSINPTYVIEVISEKFDKLNLRQQDEVLLHELAHIPSTFSGALLSHTRKRKGSFHEKLGGMITKYRRSK